MIADHTYYEYEGTAMVQRFTGTTQTISSYSYHATADVAIGPPELPDDPPPEQPVRVYRLLPSRRMLPQVAGVHRHLRFLQGPICRGGTK